MTIIEALRSGKPFRRPSIHYTWLKHDELNRIVRWTNTNQNILITTDDILATDWEVKEEKSELLPCPFCGGEVDIDYDNGSDDYMIECPKCNARMPYYDREGDIIAAWNKRIDQKDGDKDALIRKLNEERNALMERVNELVQRDDECAKAYNAGAAAMMKTLSLHSLDYKPFSEWKRGQK